VKNSGPEHPRLDADRLVRWLQSEGSSYRETVGFLDAFAAEALRTGLLIDRVTTGVPVLHPQVDSLSCLWEKGRPVSERRFRLDDTGLQQFRNSPIYIVYSGGSFRRRLEGAPETQEFPILAELRADGFTDYLALPLRFSSASWKAMTFATKHPGGFPDDQVAVLSAILPTLALLLEIQTLHRTTLTLLDTYVGPVAGRRVLDGAIRLGMYDMIQAVIWVSDLRGFTDLSERLPGGDLVGFLNDYFGAITEAVVAHGGEVLKFIGDAVLAIFPLAKDGDHAAARRALAAAVQVGAAIETLNAARAASGQPLIRYGLGLHAGEVLYGNIGGSDRLDFTVIGQAVNVASRIEGLCKVLDRRVLLSGELAELCGEGVQLVGHFPLRGVGKEQAIYAPIVMPTT
jgi:adenylate cyclase